MREANNKLQWIDDTHISFLFSDAQGVRQVMSVDVVSGEIRQLTRSPTSVRVFDVSKDGTVLYRADARMDTRRDALSRRPVVLPPGTDVYALFRGDTSGRGFLDWVWNSEWFLQSPDAKVPIKLVFGGRSEELLFNGTVRFSPDGSRAIVLSNPQVIPEEWDAYLQSPDAWLGWHSLREARNNQWTMAARAVTQFHVLNVNSKQTRPLFPAMTLFGGFVIWSPDSREILLAPTHLPPGADEAGVSGQAVATVDVESGRFLALPIRARREEILAAVWVDADTIDLQLREASRKQTRTERFVRQDSRWERVGDGASAGSDNHAAIRFELEADPGTPARLIAADVRDPAKRRVILDPNAALARKLELGITSEMRGEVEGTGPWSAQIVFPPGYRSGQPLPLVIQAQYGGPKANTDFSFYSSARNGTGPAPDPAYTGHLLAAHGIVVATVNFSVRLYTADEGHDARKAMEDFARLAIREGIAAADKIGAIGFSRNGWYVEHLLAFSDLPLAAAVTVDNMTASYMSAAVQGWPADYDLLNGGAPFGSGMHQWLQNVPSFNAERIRAPLRIVSLTFGLENLLHRWELYSKLRRLQRPVEAVVLREYGCHNPQNPTVLLALQEETIDWFRFWLQGDEDPSPRKAEQYARWRELRKLQ